MNNKLEELEQDITVNINKTNTVIKNDNALKKFFNIFKLFKKESQYVIPSLELAPSLETKEIVKPNPFIEKFDQFYLLEKYNLVVDMLKNGYQPNVRQKNTINKYIKDTLMERSDNVIQCFADLDLVNTYLELGFPLEKSDLAHICSNIFLNKNNSIIDFRTLLNTEEVIAKSSSLSKAEKPFHFLTKELREYVQQNNLPLSHLNSLFSQEIKPKEKSFTKEVHFGINFLRHFSLMIEDYPEYVVNNLHFDDYVLIMTKIINQEPPYSDMNSSDASRYHRTIEVYLNQNFKHYENNIHNMLDDIKNDNLKEYIEQKTSAIVSANIKNIKVNNLPYEANDILQSINVVNNHIHKFLKSHPEHELHNDFDLINLLEKRLPEILQKYLTIDESYRTTLTNSENKNAEELMLDSLYNIKSNIEKKWELLNQEKLSDLSVTNRYTRNFK